MPGCCLLPDRAAMTLPDVTPTPSVVRMEQRGDEVHVLEAPPVAQFHYDWLYEAARIRAVTVFGLDVVIHAANGDFHYRFDEDLPNGTVLMRRVDG